MYSEGERSFLETRRMSHSEAIVLSATVTRIDRRWMRTDPTVVDGWAHATDSSLIFDEIRLLVELVRRAERVAGFMPCHRYLKRATRRLVSLQRTAPQDTRSRREAFSDLVAVARTTVDYAVFLLERLRADLGSPSEFSKQHRKRKKKLERELASSLSVAGRVIARTTACGVAVAGEVVPGFPFVMIQFAQARPTLAPSPEMTR